MATKTKLQKKPKAQRSLQIRMYNVGFGDSFLVRMPTEDGGESRMLIDCGVFPAGPGPVPIGDVCARIVSDVTDADGVARINVVVGTHRHADHVSGFAQRIWDRVRVDEVWMPWTEDYRDCDARKILEAQSKIAEKLKKFAVGFGAASIKQFAENSLKNSDAMNTLHHGFSGGPTVRYLPPPNRVDHTFTTDALPGVTIHVLGPSRDSKVVRDMNPPTGHSYLRAAEASEAILEGNLAAFLRPWQISEEDLAEHHPSLLLSSQDRSLLNAATEMDLMAVAVGLDQAVNGTSLMLLLEVGQHHLLFPGDAQWGTWAAAMDDEEWRELLCRTNFYKVGHHGSHNATPTDFLELLTGGVLGAAMVSTRPHTSAWKDIPRLPLLDALATNTANVARSDTPVGSSAAFVRDPGELFVDYDIPLV